MGNEAVVELLLEHGADINARGGCYGSALAAASFDGNEAVVQLLRIEVQSSFKLRIRRLQSRH